jgi:hypothetical protein
MFGPVSLRDDGSDGGLDRQKRVPARPAFARHGSRSIQSPCPMNAAAKAT